MWLLPGRLCRILLCHFICLDPCLTKLEGRSIHKGAKSPSRENLDTCPLPAQFQWSISGPPWSTWLWASDMLTCAGREQHLFPAQCGLLRWHLHEVQTSPFFTNDQGLRLVTAKTITWSLSKAAHTFCSHLLWSLQPLDSPQTAHRHRNPTKLCRGKEERVLRQFIKIYNLHVAVSA